MGDCKFTNNEEIALAKVSKKHGVVEAILGKWQVFSDPVPSSWKSPGLCGCRLPHLKNEENGLVTFIALNHSESEIKFLHERDFLQLSK